MSESQPIRLFAAVTRSEQPAILTGAQLLSRAIASARKDGDQPVTLTLGQPEAAPKADQPLPHLIVTSLLAEVDGAGEDYAGIRTRWSNRLRVLQGGDTSVFLCTVFRHVPDRERRGGSNPTLRRIRELNLLAIELSHDLGIGIVDIDRILAYFGARTIKDDYRLAGPVTADIAGYAIASALLAHGVDDVLDPLFQEKALAFLGGLDNVPALLRQLQEMRRRQSQNVMAKNG